MFLSPTDRIEIENRWLEKLKPKRNKRKHNYLHFDLRIKDPKVFLPLIVNENKIAVHPFLPFVRFEKKKYKYKLEGGRRKLIKKFREIMYACHLDTLIYVWYQCILEKSYEQILIKEKLTSNVLAYRKLKNENGKGKCNIDFAQEVFSEIKGECVALTFDISDFFPSLSHIFLKKRWSQILDLAQLPRDHYNVFKSLTQYSFVDLTDSGVKKILRINTPGLKAHIECFCGDEFSGEEFRKIKKKIRKLENGNTVFKQHDKDKGIPQGSPMSGLLANIYLIDFDRKINKKVTQSGGVYRRYSDDIIIVCPKSQGKKLEDFVRDEIAKEEDTSGDAYLVIKEDKTDRIIFLKEGNKLTSWEVDEHYTVTHRSPLQYLGFEFDGNKIRLRSSSVAKFYNRVKYGLKKVLRHGRKGPPLLKRKFFGKYTPLGKSNFLSYVSKAGNIILNNRFSKQLRKNWPFIKKKIDTEKSPDVQSK